MEDLSENKENNIERVTSENENINNAVKDGTTKEISKREESNIEKATENKDISNKDEDNIMNETSEYEESNIEKVTSENKSTNNAMEDKNNEHAKDKDCSRHLSVESETEDVEDYCSDATYLARKMASEEKLSRSDSKKLYDLYVQLRHTVPLQHKIETRAGSHMPTREQIEKFEEIIPLKRGTYSAQEDDIISRNWKAFCKLHDWNASNPKPFLQLRNNLKARHYVRNITERRKFVQFLADGLPNRTLYSVYYRFRNLYEGNLHRRFNKEEDKMIIDHLENNPSLDEKRKYADLAKVLRRTRNSIWRRYKLLKGRNEEN